MYTWGRRECLGVHSGLFVSSSSHLEGIELCAEIHGRRPAEGPRAELILGGSNGSPGIVNPPDGQPRPATTATLGEKRAGQFEALLAFLKL